jgi:inner membrane protein
METKESSQNKLKSVNWQITLKVLIIGVITIALLVPKFMILDLIGQRQHTAEESSREVMQSWSLDQTVRGPALTIPYFEQTMDGSGKEINNEKEFYLLPEKLEIDGQIFPEKRKRSIYETVVYESEMTIAGHFDISDLNALKIHPENILWEKAKILVAVHDLRGINNRVEFGWNDSVFAFSPGMENKLVGTNGISLQIP